MSGAALVCGYEISFCVSRSSNDAVPEVKCSLGRADVRDEVE